jgi:hypothetical protein
METDSDAIIKLSVFGILMVISVWYILRGTWIYIFWLILTALDLVYLFFVIFANTTSAVDLIPPLIILVALIFWINKIEKKK